MPSLFPLELARRIAVWAIWPATAYAIFVATFRVDLPGLYYDELLFLPPSFLILGECGTYAPVSATIGSCFPLLLAPFYLGPLKSYLYVPLLAIFPVSPELIRLPPALLAIGVALLSYPFLAPRIGRLWAAFATLLLLTSPIYLWHARVDWGPFIVGATFRFLVLAFLIRWLETSRPMDLMFAGAAFCLGMYDKVNFAWLLPPLIVATLAVYPRSAFSAIAAHPGKVLTILGLCAGVALFFLFYSIVPALELQLYPRGQTLSENASRVISLLRVTFSGAAQFQLMFNSPFLQATWLDLVFIGQLTIGTVVFAFILVFWRDLSTHPTSGRQLKLFLFFHLLLIGSVVVLVMSADVTGSHHAVFLLPLTAYQAAAMLNSATIIAAGRFVRVGVSALAITLAAFVIGDQLRVGAKYLDALRRDDSAYKPNFTAEIYALARKVGSLGADAIISVDWGVHMQLVSLAPAGQRNRYKDRWPFFNDTAITEGQTNPILEQMGAESIVVFVSKPPGRSVFPQATANFQAAIETLPQCARARQERPTSRDVGRDDNFIILRVENSCR